MDRRSFVRNVALGGASIAIAGRFGLGWPTPAGATAWPPARGVTGEDYQPSPTFPQGVASGDPTPDGVTLWTRVEPGLDAGTGVAVVLEVATTPTFADGTIVSTSGVVAAAPTDHTVLVDLADLTADTTYYYRFTAGGQVSPLGRTRTTPAANSERPVRVAAFSCQRYVHGYFNAHRHLASLAANPATDIDLVLSLGDYIYETGPADGVVVTGRVDVDKAAVTLEEFRAKYRLYRSDPYLQAMHAAYPVAAIFDNHDGMADPNDPMRAGAVAAFYEYMPVGPAARADTRQYRRLQLGAMADVLLTDQRSFRDPVVRGRGLDDAERLGTGLSSLAYPEMLDPNRTMLGRPDQTGQADQMTWLLDGLRDSGATWRVLGSQLMFWPWRSQAFPAERDPENPLRRNPGRYLNMTQWDGYQADRQAILDLLEENSIDNTVVLSGDSHLWSAAQVSPDWDDPNRPPVLVEFAASSVTSANAGEQPSRYPPTSVVLPLLRTANPHTMEFFKAEGHGYVVVEFSEEQATATFYEVDTVTQAGGGARVLAEMTVATKTNTITGGLGPPPPGRPENVRATPGNRQVTLAWGPPAFTGRTAITGYRVERLGPGGTWQLARNAAATARSATVTGLTNGTSYRFRVVATNGTGAPTPSFEVAVTPRTVPGAPRSVRATPGNRRATVAWQPPSSTGGSRITGYRIQRSTNGRNWSNVSTRPATARSFTVTNLRRGTTYRFRVVALNAAGVGAPSRVVPARPR